MFDWNIPNLFDYPVIQTTINLQLDRIVETELYFIFRMKGKSSLINIELYTCKVCNVYVTRVLGLHVYKIPQYTLMNVRVNYYKVNYNTFYQTTEIIMGTT